MSLSRDGLVLALTSGETHQNISVYDLESGSGFLLSIGAAVYGLELSLDGKEVYVATQDSIAAYELKQRLKRWEYGHELWDYCTPPALSTLSADGALFARKGNQNAILVYDLHSQKLVRVIAGLFSVSPSGGCNAISLGGQRHIVVIGTTHGVVQLFKLDGPPALARKNGHDIFMATVKANFENLGAKILAAIAADPNGDIAKMLTSEDIEEIQALLQDYQNE